MHPPNLLKIKRSWSTRGISVVEMLVSLAIGVIASAVFATLIEIQTLYSLRANDQSQFNELMNKVHAVLSDGLTCSSFFGGMPLPTPVAPPGTVSVKYGFTKVPLAIVNGGVVTPFQEQPFNPGNNNFGRINIDRIRVQNVILMGCSAAGTAPDTTTGAGDYCPGRGSFDLFIRGNSFTGTGAYSGMTYNSTAKVYYTVDPNPQPTPSPGINYLGTCIAGAYGVNMDPIPAPNNFIVFPVQICTEMGLIWNGSPGPGTANCSLGP